MTEYDEIAVNIAAKVGDACLKGLRSMRDAENIVKLYMRDETTTVICNTAESLLRIARAKYPLA